MAIPLIQNVEKQDINTSIIAIRRQLEQLYNALGVTESTISSGDVSTSTGTPLGTWASFENDYAPNIEWLQGGTTFNPNTYPALAMYLGGNTVPERYDYDRPSAIENVNGDSGFTLSTTNSVAPYDGIITIGYSSSSSKDLYINDVKRAISGNCSGGNTLSYNVKKGDLVRCTTTLTLTDPINNVIWFKHPLFIKATPTSADSDYEGTLNAIREFYVRNNTYSTEERLTGGVWIDGKPIYRRVMHPENNISSNGWRNCVQINNVSTVLGDIISLYGVGLSFNGCFYMGCQRASGGTYIQSYSQQSFTTADYIILEYTKTTD